MRLAASLSRLLAGELWAVAGVALLLSIMFFFSWGPAPSGAERRFEATVQEIGSFSGMKYRPGRYGTLEARLSDGRIVRVPVTPPEVAQCRSGDHIALAGAPSNAGAINWRVLPEGCSPLGN